MDERIKEGALFDSFEELDEAIKAFGKQTNVQFVVANYKSITAANKHILDNCKSHHPKFKYRFVKFVCKHGGDRRIKGSGARPNQNE